MTRLGGLGSIYRREDRKTVRQAPRERTFRFRRQGESHGKIVKTVVVISILQSAYSACCSPSALGILSLLTLRQLNCPHVRDEKIRQEEIKILV